jgi:Flp pilus assembly protein TadG
MISRALSGRESGQYLILFTLMILVVMMFLVLTIDVGMLYVERRNGQNVIDAAALAGAQELPDVAAATAKAREYAALNGADPDDLVISFGCTSTLSQACNASAGKYDTVYIDYAAQAQPFFGPVVALVDSSSCWATGCSTDVHAAACQGHCGAPSKEVDVVAIIDHTRSMTATDLANAKDGAKALMKTFDATMHNLALAVTPPVDPSNHCDTINSWNDAKTWVPVQLNGAYQSAPNVLDNSSKLVSTTNCLDIPTTSELSGFQTNLGDPLKAAMQELQARGRTGAKWGIVLETDGAANIMDTVAAASLGAKGPCDYAYKVAQLVKNAGIELYTVGYGADDKCSQDLTTSPWYNRPANELITAMATDSSHAFIEPKTSDLEPVFQEIGIELGGGSKLVE